jgi:uncharacterized repeat protein (TIGR02543 family)
MKTRIALLLISALLLAGCNNFIHDLIPEEEQPAADDPSAPVSYTVRFDKNGADTDAVPASAATTHGGTVPLPAADPAWANHTFEGWWTENGYGNSWGAGFTASTPVTADITVYAKWTPPPNSYYTVTFDKNNSDPGSTGASPNTRGAAYGSTVNLPAPPARPGYAFSGWWTADGSGGNWGAGFTASTPVTADITVYARWAAPLILVISGNSFVLPTNNPWSYNWTIDWGDGSSVETKTGTGASTTGISHTYPSNAQYTIKITANSNTGHAAFGFGSGAGGVNVAVNKQKLLKALGHIKENTSVAGFPNAWAFCFHDCTNLNEVSPDLLPNVDNGTESIFIAMFSGCTGLTSLPAGFQLPAVSNGWFKHLL